MQRLSRSWSKTLCVGAALVGGLTLVGAAFAQSAQAQSPQNAQLGATDAQVSATSEQTSVNQPIRDQDNIRSAKLICKTDRVTGTRLHKVSICRTAKEWRDIRRGWQKETKFMTDRGAAASQGERGGGGG